eukprot:15481323-Alexandrium_andersonii.AAC.1
MAERSPRLGVPPAGAFDLRPGLGGIAWDFDRADGRGWVIRLLGARRPYIIAGSPLRVGWWSFNVHIDHPGVHPEVVAERARKARARLAFVAKLYRAQLERGARFLREHPATASWSKQR